MSQILVGPAGWSYADWKGTVYPESPGRGFDELPFIARHFPCVELNNTFYRPPSARMSAAWAKKTPDGFVFTAKAWEKFTHGEASVAPAEARLFLEGLAPLVGSGKLGALLLQFPWSFRDAPDARDRLRRAVDALSDAAPLVVEVRHRSWLDALDFLRELKLAFCNIDQPRSTQSISGTDIVLGPLAYVRLHGRNARAWFRKDAGRDEKYDYLYSPAELREWAARVEKMPADRVFVILNNHFRGKGVVNALQFMRLLGQSPEVPETLLRSYPAELSRGA